MLVKLQHAITALLNVVVFTSIHSRYKKTLDLELMLVKTITCNHESRSKKTLDLESILVKTTKCNHNARSKKTLYLETLYVIGMQLSLR